MYQTEKIMHQITQKDKKAALLARHKETRETAMDSAYKISIMQQQLQEMIDRNKSRLS